MQNFVDAVKSRKQPVSPLADAVRSDIISHLCDIAVRLKRKITWDPQDGADRRRRGSHRPAASRHAQPRGPFEVGPVCRTGPGDESKNPKSEDRNSKQIASTKIEESIWPLAVSVFGLSSLFRISSCGFRISFPGLSSCLIAASRSLRWWFLGRVRAGGGPGERRGPGGGHPRRLHVRRAADFVAAVRRLDQLQADLEFDAAGNLAAVDLSGGRKSVGDDVVDVLPVLTHLKKLRVTGGEVTDAGARRLAAIHSLADLALLSSQIDNDGLGCLCAPAPDRFEHPAQRECDRRRARSPQGPE